MLHKIIPIMDNNRIQRFIEIQYGLLEFICDPDNPLLEDTDTDLGQQIKNVCADRGIAEWLSDGRRKEIRNKISGIGKYLAGNPHQRDALRDAFQHDYNFYKSLDDETFVFAYFSLDDELRKLATSLFLYLYDYLGGEGYPDVVMIEAGSFTRYDFISLFEQNNPSLKVCPMCDGKRPDMIGDKRLSDLDHFLPKSKYPLLAVHPRNLVPVCLECNERIKREGDPLLYGEAISLTNSFHPFSDVAAIDLILVKCDRNENGVAHILIEDTERGLNSIRLETLNEILGLEERWTNRLEEIKESLYEKIREWRYFTASIDNEDDLETCIRDAINGSIDQVRFGSQPNRIVYKSYLSFVLVDVDEFELIMSEYI